MLGDTKNLSDKELLALFDFGETNLLRENLLMIVCSTRLDLFLRRSLLWKKFERNPPKTSILEGYNIRLKTRKQNCMKALHELHLCLIRLCSQKDIRFIILNKVWLRRFNYEWWF